MDTTERIEFAAALSKYAHRGQTDKAGRPYWEHPDAVASLVSSEDEKIVAYLHDVLEDTDVTEDTLRNLFGDTVTDAVKMLTHAKSEPYMDYIRRVKENELAKNVKLADLTHNMNLKRLPVITEKDEERLKKYREAALILLA